MQAAEAKAPDAAVQSTGVAKGAAEEAGTAAATVVAEARAAATTNPGDAALAAKAHSAGADAREDELALKAVAEAKAM